MLSVCSLTGTPPTHCHSPLPSPGAAGQAERHKPSTPGSVGGRPCLLLGTCAAPRGSAHVLALPGLPAARRDACCHPTRAPRARRPAPRDHRPRGERADAALPGPRRARGRELRGPAPGLVDRQGRREAGDSLCLGRAPALSAPHPAAWALLTLFRVRLLYRRSWLGSDPAGGHHWGCARRPLPAGGRAARSRPERPESHDGRAIVRGTCRVQRPGCRHHPRPSPLLFSGCPRAEPPRTPRPSQTPRAGPLAIPPLPALHACLSRSRPAAPGTARGQEEARALHTGGHTAGLRLGI